MGFNELWEERTLPVNNPFKSSKFCWSANLVFIWRGEKGKHQLKASALIQFGLNKERLRQLLKRALHLNYSFWRQVLMILMFTLNSFFWAEILIMVFCAEFEKSFGSNLFMRIAWKANSFVCRWQGVAYATDCAHSRSSTQLFPIHCSLTNPMQQLFSDYRLALNSAWCRFVCRCIRPLTGGPCTLRLSHFPAILFIKSFAYKNSASIIRSHH